MTGTEFYFMSLLLGRESLPEGEEGSQVCSGEDEGVRGAGTRVVAMEMEGRRQPEDLG